MIEIVKSKNKQVRVSVKVCSDASLGSWGSHQLLLDQYRLEEDKELEPKWATTKKGKTVYDQMVFNTKWLESILAKYGELHCEYCGKANLVIYPWYKIPNVEILATTDHFYPQKTHPHLAKDIKNFIVSCHRCNTNKKAKAINKSAIKFPYPEVRNF